MNTKENKAITWFFDFKTKLTNAERLGFFPHPESEDVWNLANDSQEKRVLKLARAQRTDFSFFLKWSVNQLSEHTKEEINQLTKIYSVIVGSIRGYGDSLELGGSTGPATFIILTEKEIHTYTQTATNTALGLAGLAFSAIKNRGRKYIHESFSIQEFLSTVKTRESLGVPSSFITTFFKKDFRFIIPANLKHFKSECEKLLLILPSGVENKTNKSEDFNYIIELKELKILVESGILTEEEFLERKRNILKNI